MPTTFPDSLLISIAQPVDDKSLFNTIEERNNLPISLRYKGLITCIKGAMGQPPTYWCLNSDNLNNSGWAQIYFNGETANITIDDWKPKTSYIRYQPIVNDGILYRARDSHISDTVFNVNYWETIGGGSGSGEFSFYYYNSIFEFPVNGNSKTLYIVKTFGEEAIYRWNQADLEYYIISNNYNNIKVISGGGADIN